MSLFIKEFHMPHHRSVICVGKHPSRPFPGKESANAWHFRPSPIQPKPVSFLMIGPEFVVPQEPLSEDCLYLNIWTAAHSSDEKRPVLLWIYGGGFHDRWCRSTGIFRRSPGRAGNYFCFLQLPVRHIRISFASRINSRIGPPQFGQLCTDGS